MLERQHGVTWEALKLGQADATAAKNLRNDARLLKTLLLGALVPEVESLKGLTAQRLAALNHGTFKSPIPGREAQDVLRKCRDWVSEISEIKITEDQNPVVSIQVTGVDIEPILRAAEANDNAGNRRKRIREALFGELNIADSGGLFTTYEFTWRGTKREVELLYENVREMTDDRLRGRSGAWTVVLDFPFDDANFGPADDLARLGEYRGGDTRTLVWLPSFLSNKALADLGRLVVLDYILQGDRFDNYAGHLSFVDKVQAKALAKNQLDQLRIKLRSQLEVAYGISTEPRDAVSNALSADQQFKSLDPTLSPRPPVGADFRAAFESLLGQLFAHQYPAHPEFETEIKASVIKKVWPEVQKAIEAPGQRGLVQDASTRKLVRAVVNPSQLGQMGETHLLIEPHWQARFAQSHARDGGGVITVGKLRQWIDTPAPMGLPLELQNLIILAYAASTNRRFTLRGGPVEPTIDSLSDDLELKEQTLPNAADWQTALQRASSLFGLTLAQTLNAANVGRLVVLDHILQGDRFETYTGHLSLVDRVQAKALARNQLDQLRIKLRSQLEVAYGISTEPRDAVSSPLTADQQFRSLDPTLSPRPPVGADFKSAFESLLGQLFAHQYPAHPEFDTEIKPAVIRKIWPEVQKAIEAPGQRGLVQDTGLRKLVRSVVNPCQLGQMAETHLLIEPHWQSRFSQSHARDGGGPITVAKLRQWIDMPAPMGLPLELQNLIILAFAASTSRRFTMRGGPFEPSVDSMPDELELREQSLPSAGDWQLALQRASSLFGLTLGQTLNAANVGKLVDEIKQKVAEKRDAVTRLVVQVRDRAGRYAAGSAGARQQTAESAQSLLAAVASAADSELVAALAGSDLQTSEAAVGRALGQAKACADVLELGSYWQLFDVVLKLSDHRAGAAQVIGRRLAEGLTSDEHVLALKGRLDELHRDAMALLAEAAPAPVPGPGPAPVQAPGTPTPPPVTIPPVPASLAPEVVAEKQQLHLSGAEAVAALEELKARMTSERDLELTLSWRLQRKGTQL